MSGLWWCVVCSNYRRFAVFAGPPVDFVCCQFCGQGVCVTPEPIKEEGVA